MNFPLDTPPPLHPQRGHWSAERFLKIVVLMENGDVETKMWLPSSLTTLGPPLFWNKIHVEVCWYIGSMTRLSIQGLMVRTQARHLWLLARHSCTFATLRLGVNGYLSITKNSIVADEASLVNKITIIDIDVILINVEIIIIIDIDSTNIIIDVIIIICITNMITTATIIVIIIM